MLESVADVWRECCHETPPNVGGGLQDIVAAIRSGRRLQRLSMAHRRAVLDVLTKSVGDLLDAWFESAALKAALGYEAIAGHYASPYTPGTAYVLLHHMLGEVNGQRGATGHVVGGMGAITEAMAAEARLRGVYIETNVSVEKVIVDQRGAQGVQLQDGRIIEASCVVANVNPKMLYLDMVDAVALDQNFLHTLRQWKCASASFRMNVALSELPNFTCLPNQPDESSALHHQSSIVMAPSLRYMEQAYFDARTYGCARAPVIEMLIPSTVDDSLAPPGQHVASLCCQHFSPDLPEGLSWDGIREDAADHVIDTVTRFAPNFKSAILGRSILSPLDLEREFGLLGGDIYHGALTLDQLWSARPMLGHADYRGPIRKLYLCGAGAHPGGGVSGLPGRNAAREIVADFKHGKLKHR
jgi:phytoene dehydrogenase-like protein